jgi:hypothetical protein
VEDAVNSLRIAFACDESVKTGLPVMLPLKNRNANVLTQEVASLPETTFITNLHGMNFKHKSVI